MWVIQRSPQGTGSPACTLQCIVVLFLHPYLWVCLILSNPQMEFHCLDTEQFSPSSVGGNLGYLHLFAVTRLSAITACVCTSFGRSVCDLRLLVCANGFGQQQIYLDLTSLWTVTLIYGLQFDICSLQSPVFCLELLEVFF